MHLNRAAKFLKAFQKRFRCRAENRLIQVVLSLDLAIVVG
jgi:hypothetical protein